MRGCREFGLAKLSSKPTEQNSPQSFTHQSHVSSCHPVNFYCIPSSFLSFDSLLLCKALQCTRRRGEAGSKQHLPPQVSTSTLQLREVPAQVLPQGLAVLLPPEGRTELDLLRRAIFNSFHQLQSQGFYLAKPSALSPGQGLHSQWLGFGILSGRESGAAEPRWEPWGSEHRAAAPTSSDALLPQSSR